MQTASQFMRYLVVGALNTALNFLVLNALSLAFHVYSGIGIIPITVATASVVIIQSYVLNKYWTFKSIAGTGKKRVEFSKFVLINFCALVLNTTIVYVLTTYAAPAGIHPLAWENIATALAIGVAIIWNFFGFKFFVFRGGTQTSGISAPKKGKSLFELYHRHRKLLERIGMLSIAMLMGLLQLMPSVFLERAVRASGGDFLIAQMTHHGDTAIHYLPKAREVIDGHFPAIDVHVPENRNGLFLWVPGPQVVFAAALLIFPDVNHAYMALGFAFTAIMFLLMYWLGRTLCASRVGAILLGMVVVLTPITTNIDDAILSVRLFMDILGKNFIPVVHSPIHQLFLSRIEHPLLTMWLYMLVFTLAYRFFMLPSVKRAVALGLAVGLQLYFYLHFWMYIVILIGLLFLYTYLFRRGDSLRPWFLLGGIIAVAAIPYAINFLLLSGLPHFSDQSFRIGFEYGWGFRLSVWSEYLFYVLLGAFAFLLLPPDAERKRAFIALTLLAMVVGLNVQLFLGWNPQPDHWLKVYGVPLVAVASLVIAAGIDAAGRIFKFKYLRASFLILGVVLSVLLVAKKIVNAAVFIHPTHDWITDYSFYQPITDSWTWINRNLPKSPVFISNSLITSIYLTGYTSADPYPVFAQNSVASNFEVEQRFLIAHKLFGTSPDRLKWLLEYRKNPFLGCTGVCDTHSALNLSKAPAFLYGQTFNSEFNTFDSLAKQSGVSNYAIPPDKIRQMVERYKALRVDWKDYSGDYVYVGPWERELTPGLDFSKNLALEQIYGKAGVEIYRVK